MQSLKRKQMISLLLLVRHETYQIIGKEVHHFDDREVAKEAITGRLNNEE